MWDANGRDLGNGMIRHLFTVAATLSLVLFVVCVAAAFWASSNSDSRFVARNGRLWCVGRSNGEAMLLSMPWPRDEPYILNDPAFQSFLFKGGWRSDYWLAGRGGGMATMYPRLADPWGKSPVPRPGMCAFFLIRFWRGAMTLAVLSLTWAAWRFWPKGKQVVTGFEVRPAGALKNPGNEPGSRFPSDSV